MAKSRGDLTADFKRVARYVAGKALSIVGLAAAGMGAVDGHSGAQASASGEAMAARARTEKPSGL